MTNNNIKFAVVACLLLLAGILFPIVAAWFAR